MCNIHYFLFINLIDVLSYKFSFLRTSHCYKIMGIIIASIFWSSSMENGIIRVSGLVGAEHTKFMSVSFCLHLIQS